ncbi:RNA polymerase sigma factor [Nitrospina watsonii]|uniref:RNA polymerase subunit sigma-70 n=1 Tax=Nitrospina watsonii TaxID=1323948 RepID=A0ABM9HBV6_9BACT|nr:RNA polymerase sigma factor [Nitrospina watsonii]CAI2717589.1 RNA polymerase subunit sigma-70 [Nitrospina watsonii]
MKRSHLTSLVQAFESHYDELKRFVARRVGCSSVAEDIVQETWVRITSSPPTDPVENARAYLYRVARNLMIDFVRRDRVRSRYIESGVLPENVSNNEPHPESLLIQKERLAHLLKAVEELPPRCQQVFRLRKFEHLEQAEIARRLGISRNMVEKHLRKALAHCLASLEEAE